MAVEAERDEDYRTPGLFGWDRGPGNCSLDLSSRADGDHPFHPAHDGIAGCAETFHRFLDFHILSERTGGHWTLSNSALGTTQWKAKVPISLIRKPIAPTTPMPRATSLR